MRSKAKQLVLEVLLFHIACIKLYSAHVKYNLLYELENNAVVVGVHVCCIYTAKK